MNNLRLLGVNKINKVRRLTISGLKLGFSVYLANLFIQNGLQKITAEENDEISKTPKHLKYTSDVPRDESVILNTVNVCKELPVSQKIKPLRCSTLMKTAKKTLTTVKTDHVNYNSRPFKVRKITNASMFINDSAKDNEWYRTSKRHKTTSDKVDSGSIIIETGNRIKEQQDKMQTIMSPKTAEHKILWLLHNEDSSTQLKSSEVQSNGHPEY